MQKQTYTTGGYVLHNLPTPRARASAWFDHTGSMLDAELIDSGRRSRNIKRGSPLWDRLQTIGRAYR